VAMGPQGDDWIAAVASFVRNNFGNTGGFITPEDVARVRADTAARNMFWTIPEVTASMPAALFTDGWKLTASHNSEAAIGALTLTGWNAGGTQQPGMWLQVELPRTETVTEVQFQSPTPGGRGGAGNAAAVSSSGAPITGPLGFPRGYKVEVFTDGSSWRSVAEGTGTGASTISTFQPAPAKFVRVSLTTGVDDAPAWSVQNLKIYALASPERKSAAPPVGRQ